MHIIAILFFLGALLLAVGSIAVMFARNADRILMALSGNGIPTPRGVTFVTFAGFKHAPRPVSDPANDRISLPLAA